MKNSEQNWTSINLCFKSMKVANISFKKIAVIDQCLTNSRKISR